MNRETNYKRLYRGVWMQWVAVYQGWGRAENWMLYVTSHLANQRANGRLFSYLNIHIWGQRTRFLETLFLGGGPCFPH